MLRKLNSMHRTVLLMILFLPVMHAQQVYAAGSVPDSLWKPEGLQTPEPGTKINPVADLILHYANKLEVNPDSVMKKYIKRLNLGGPRIHHVLDTTVMHEGYPIPVRVCYPMGKKNKSSSIMVYFHGGAFLFGDNNMYDKMLRKLVRETNCIVVSAEYRLAPDHPFPEGVNDCYYILQWVAANLKTLGAEGKKIGVAGDSAGGNLAAVMTLMSRDKNGPPIAWQVLYYPATTFRDTMYASLEYFSGLHGKHYMLSATFLHKVKTEYMGKFTNDRDPYLSPLDASLSSNLPRALVITAKCDPLRDEGHDYASRLRRAGVPVTYREAKGMIHGFINFYPILRQGRKAIRLTAAFINSDQQ